MRYLRGVGIPALGIVCLLLIPLALSATTVVSFETGLPVDWTLIDTEGYSGPVTNIEPADGPHFGWITTAGGRADPDLKHGDDNGAILLSSLLVHSSYPLDAGSYQMEFVAVNYGDFRRPRPLVLDGGVNCQPPPPPPPPGVPEPSAAVLAGIGVVLIGLRRMRSRAKGKPAARRGRR